jgi:hypothetical protein
MNMSHGHCLVKFTLPSTHRDTPLKLGAKGGGYPYSFPSPQKLVFCHWGSICPIVFWGLALQLLTAFILGHTLPSSTGATLFEGWPPPPPPPPPPPHTQDIFFSLRFVLSHQYACQKCMQKCQYASTSLIFILFLLNFP